MHIQHIEVGNFRKLKAVRIDFSETNTVFVGANNSGKTSAMVALRRFHPNGHFSIQSLLKAQHGQRSRPSFPYRQDYRQKVLLVVDRCR
jgi:predicted ATP-dependent endonuclease of OLD family